MGDGVCENDDGQEGGDAAVKDCRPDGRHRSYETRVQVPAVEVEARISKHDGERVSDWHIMASSPGRLCCSKGHTIACSKH